MMSQKEAPPRKVAKMVWISIQFSFVEYDGCFQGASFYVLSAGEGSTHNYLLMAGNLHQIAYFSRKQPRVLPGCFLLWHHQRVIVYMYHLSIECSISLSGENLAISFFPQQKYIMTHNNNSTEIYIVQSNALSFYRSQNILHWSIFFVPDQRLEYNLRHFKIFCASTNTKFSKWKSYLSSGTKCWRPEQYV